MKTQKSKLVIYVIRGELNTLMSARYQEGVTVSTENASHTIEKRTICINSATVSGAKL